MTGPPPTASRSSLQRGAGRARPRIDPRFRQRRVQVKREEGRRRLRFLAASAAAVAAVSGAVGATRSPLLDVDRVEVQGAAHTPRAALLAASGLDARPLMTEVDTEGVARQVEALPWVHRARARLMWPNRIAIHVTERTPAALVPAAGGGWAVVDGTGRVLDVTAARPPGLPAVAGVVAAGPPGSHLGLGPGERLRVAAALPAPLRGRVAEVVVVPSGEVVLRLAPPGGEVRLGRPDALEAKLTAATTVLEKADMARLRFLDVRVPQAPVLTRR